jgi:LmbE family N-acetylglucosaminyl deacetylase
MNCVVLATHPDDETIGCGGTLLRHKAKGDSVHWIICTSMKERFGFNRDEISNREKEIKKVEQAFSFDSVHLLDFPTTRLDECPLSDLVEKIGEIFSKIRPEIIYLPFENDVHSDHRVVFQAGFSCSKSFRRPYIKKIMMMETISETEFSSVSNSSYFKPNVYVDVSDYLAKKIEIMRIYGSELKEFPFPRSEDNIKALAMFRGASAGYQFSEAFMLLKERVSE